MKKIVRRIIVLLFILLMAFQQFCYADVIMPSPFEEAVMGILAVHFYGGFVVAVVLLVTIIAYVILKIDKAKNKYESIDYKDRVKKMRKIIAGCLLYLITFILIYFVLLTVGEIDYVIFIYTVLLLALALIVFKKEKLYVCGIILATMILIYLAKSDEITSTTFFIPIGLFVISIILRLIKNKKASNIICIISVAFVCIIGAWIGISNYMIENYNKQFMQYIEKEYNYWAAPNYVSDMEGLVNAAIKNNKSGRKTTIIYLSNEYTSPDELEQLLKKVNKGEKYNSIIQYDKGRQYIETIELISHTSYDFYRFIKEDIVYSNKDYERNVRGANVRAYINDLMTYYRNNNEEKPKLTISYISKEGEETKIDVSTENYEKLKDFSKEIKSGKTYDVEIQVNADDVYTIIITCNN